MSIDENWFDWSGSDLNLTDAEIAGVQGYVEENPMMFDYLTGNDPGFDWSGSDLNLTDEQWQEVENYIAANPDALDYNSLSNLLSGFGSGASNVMSGVGNFLKGVPTGAWGAAGMLASGLLSAKDAEALLEKQTAAQKDLLQFKHDLEKPTPWVTPAGGLLRLK